MVSCIHRPEKAQASYFLFVAAERDAVKEANPDASVTDITKILGARWGQMDDAAKAPYERKQQRTRSAMLKNSKLGKLHTDEVAAMDAQGKSGRAAKRSRRPVRSVQLRHTSTSQLTCVNVSRRRTLT